MELYFKEYGDRGDPPLLILHGLLGASGNWHTLSRTAFSEDLCVLTVDLRNHGRSPHSDTFSYPAMTADLVELIENEDLAPVHLLGHSMGGKTAMHLALHHPDLVRRLVVVDIAPKAYPPHHEHIFEALRAIDLDAYDDRDAIDRALAERLPERAVRQFLLKNLEYDGAGGYTWKMNLEGIYQNYDQINKAIEADAPFEKPTLFVRGERSDYIDDADEDRIRQHFPQAELVTIEGAGHWVHADRPQALAEVALRFLRAEETA